MTKKTRGLFITGTGTGVGKTLLASHLMKHSDACYWKPVQCGNDENGRSDAQTVAAASAADACRILPSRYVFTLARSPHEAARKDGVSLALRDFSLPRASRPLIVEGAGGALTPLGETTLMADLMLHLGLPVLVAAQSALGTINHSLLTLEALRRREIFIIGVALCGTPDAENRRAIERYGNVSVLCELPFSGLRGGGGLVERWLA